MEEGNERYKEKYVDEKILVPLSFHNSKKNR